MKHKTTITDITRTHGYGPRGHGTWKVTCTCGWEAVSTQGGRNRAEAIYAYGHLRENR